MRDKREFGSILQAIDGAAPCEYAQLSGDFDFSRFVLHTQRIGVGEPGAGSTLFVLHVPQLIAGFPAELSNTAIRRTALEDYLARSVADTLARITRSAGTPEARAVAIAQPGDEILPRSSIIVAQDFVEARVTIQLPVVDGRIDAEAAGAIFFEILPILVNESLLYCYHDEDRLRRHIETMEDTDVIRQSLTKRGLVSFIGEGSRLPGRTEAFTIDDACAITIDVPNAGSLRGIGLPAGVSLVVGDSYSGRQELVSAIGMGIYNHIPGDGREFVVTIPDAVTVEAEPGRSIQRVNVSPFLAPRPGCDPAAFTTPCASAAESQMASLMEAVQVGAQAIVLDEDTSDPSFLAADVKMLARDGELPRMFPLAGRARQMAEEWRISVVVGACACAEEFVPAANAIFRIENGRIRDITTEAREKFGAKNLAVAAAGTLPSFGVRDRVVVPSSIDAGFGREDAVIDVEGADLLTFGRCDIDLTSLSQISEMAQAMTIGLLIYYAKLHYLDEPRTINEILDQIDEDLSSEGLDSITREQRGDLARPRRFEVAATLNRMPSLRVTPSA